MNWKRTAVVTMIALGIAGATAFAQQTQSPPPPMGPGMMGGDGPGHGPGYGPHWHGDRDDDWGWGMMGGLGGWGMGPGTMGGMGMMGGMEMMGLGLGPISRLDLSDSQRQQVLKIEDDLRRKNWDLMGRMQDEMGKLRESLWDGKRDRAAILAGNKRMSDLHQQRLENSLDAREKAEALLTPQQREELRRYAS